MHVGRAVDVYSARETIQVPPSHLSGGPSSTVADQARLLLSLAESVRSGVPPLVTTGELGEAIAVLWATIKGRIRLAQELG